jgi:bifunctional DNA-binding transcriptional regulator/antitoxin component of YhaV-PrlF toxin-antitoxin module
MGSVMAVSRRIIRIGHSYGLILPRALLQALGWAPGQRLRVEVRDGGLFILPEPAVPEEPGYVPPPRPLSEEQRRKVREILWDVPMEPEEFLDIVEGRRPHPRRAYWAARLLEQMDWWDVREVCDVRALADVWPEARRYVRSEALREDLDHAFGRLRSRLSASGEDPGSAS